MTRFPNYEGNWDYISIAENGVHGERGNTSITTYNSELEAYFGELRDGGVVIDKRPCTKHPKFVHTLVSGPMVHTALPDNTCRKCGDINPIDCTSVESCKAFDFVSMNLYVGMWKELGARVGHREGNQILWDDGEKFEIQPATIYNR